MTAPKKGPKNGCNAISDRQTNRFIHFLQKFFKIKAHFVKMHGLHSKTIVFRFEFT